LFDHDDQSLYGQDRAQSQPFWNQASALNGVTQALLEHVMDVPVMGPHQPERITVVAGDTLSAIAARYLDDMSRWPEIYRLNIDEIGSDPNVIVPNQQLFLPAL